MNNYLNFIILLLLASCQTETKLDKTNILNQRISFGTFQLDIDSVSINIDDYVTFNEIVNQQENFIKRGFKNIELQIPYNDETYVIKLSQRHRNCPNARNGFIYEGDSIFVDYNHHESSLESALQKSYFNNGKEQNLSESPNLLLINFYQNEKVPISLVKRRLINLLSTFEDVSGNKEKLNFSISIPFDPKKDFKKTSRVVVEVPNEEEIEDEIVIEIPEEFEEFYK